MLLDVYAKADTRPDAQSKARVLSILRAFPPHEPTKKRFVNDMIAWSARLGEFPAGDPELHHVAGTLYADGTPSPSLRPSIHRPIDPSIPATPAERASLC